MKKLAASAILQGMMAAMPVTLPSKSPVSKGVIMPVKEWKGRKKRLSMQKRSRKANRK